jgi:hypothetical protein
MAGVSFLIEARPGHLAGVFVFRRPFAGARACDVRRLSQGAAFGYA